jgi:predicted small secreted protein
MMKRIAVTAALLAVACATAAPAAMQHKSSPRPAIVVEHGCPLRVSAATIQRGKGLDVDSLYGLFSMTNPSGSEYVFRYQLQTRGGSDGANTFEGIGEPIAAHSEGSFRTFIGMADSPKLPTVVRTTINCTKASAT